MVHKPFEADDPMALVGVVLPADTEGMRDMAYVFAEEFARSGFDAPGILRLFQQPFYRGAHQAYRHLGAAAIRTIIAECTQIWGRVRIIDHTPSDQEGA
jgi:hypothetical protein